MTAHPQGKLDVKADGKEYTLFVGMSVLADLQAKHGQDVLEKLQQPEGAGEAWMPPLTIIKDLFAGALERYHPDVMGDRWVIDDILAENAQAFMELMGASLPDAPKGKPSGNAKRPKAAA